MSVIDTEVTRTTVLGYTTGENLRDHPITRHPTKEELLARMATQSHHAHVP